MEFNFIFAMHSTGTALNKTEISKPEDTFDVLKVISFEQITINVINELEKTFKINTEQKESKLINQRINWIRFYCIDNGIAVLFGIKTEEIIKIFEEKTDLFVKPTSQSQKKPSNTDKDSMFKNFFESSYEQFFYNFSEEEKRVFLMGT